MSNELKGLFQGDLEPQETQGTRTYRVMTPEERAQYAADMVIKHVNAIGWMLAHQVYVGFSMTSGGDLSITLLFDGEKEKIYVYKDMDVSEAEEELVAAVKRLRGLAARRR